MELVVGAAVEVAGPNDGFAQSWFRGCVRSIEQADRHGLLPRATISFVDFVNSRGEPDTEELAARFCYRLRPAQTVVVTSLKEFQVSGLAATTDFKLPPPPPPPLAAWRDCNAQHPAPTSGLCNPCRLATW